MKDYYQIPIAMTKPVETLLDRRIRDLKQKYPEVAKKRRISRARLGLGSMISLLVQDDKAVLRLLELASANMKLCRKKK